MFFHDDSLKRGGKFYLCWLADSWPLRFEQLTHRSSRLASENIPKICDDLLQLMKTESGSASKRFSLRLSSQLLRGLTRVYQRKVDFFVRDVWRINRSMSRHKFPAHVERPIVNQSHRRSAAARGQQRLVIEEIPDGEEDLEQRIRNTSNTVAREEDITLREPTLPEMRLIEDGFGELTMNLEVMLGQDDVPMQMSALGLPHDQSTDKSRDKSRLDTHDVAQMERISEYDISVFRKSAGDATALMDFEKEIPEISEIPLPDPTAPAPDKQVEDGLVEEALGQKQIEQEKRTAPEFVLEEVDITPPKKRKVMRKLIIDKIIKVSNDVLRERMQDIHVELRARFGSAQADIRGLRVPAAELLTRPAAVGPRFNRFRSRISPALLADFADRIYEERAPPSPAGRDIEMPLMQRATEPPSAPIEQPIQENVEQTIDPQLNMRALQDLTNIDISARHVQGDEPPPQIDISDLPTQKVMTVSQEKRASENEKTRRSSQRLSSLAAAAAGIPVIEPTEEPVVAKLKSMLQDAGLREAPEVPRPEPGPAPRRQTTSKDSETPLGSLDRTRVSLGCSDQTTDAQRFINREWDSLGTMIKIFRSVESRRGAVTVHSLVRRGPVRQGLARIVAARCFVSILKLKVLGYISIIKDENNEIKDIELGPRMRQHLERLQQN